MVDIIEPRQIYQADGGTRLGPQESLSLEKIRRGFLPNSVCIYDRHGRYPIVTRENTLLIQFSDFEKPFCQLKPNGGFAVVDQETFDLTCLSDVEAITCVPVSPWFDFAVMPVYTGLGGHRCPSLVDIPPEIRNLLMVDTSKLLKQFQSDFGVAYWGANNSMGGLEPIPGLMSLMDPHWQIGSYTDPTIIAHTPEEIINLRNSQDWDNGISWIIGERIAHTLKQDILPSYWPTGTVNVESDALGLHFTLPGFSPDQFADPNFIDQFWRRLSHTIHFHLCDLHAQVFDSDLSKIVEFVTKIPCSGCYNPEDYHAFFKPKSNGNTSYSREATLTHQLVEQNRHRPGFGYAASAKLYPDSSFFAITFGFGAWPTGPVEGLGLTLTRPAEPLSPELMAIRSNYYHHLTEILLN